MPKQPSKAPTSAETGTTSHFSPELQTPKKRRQDDEPADGRYYSAPKPKIPADRCCAVDEGGGGCHGRRGRGAPRGPGQDQQVQPPAPARVVDRGGVEHIEREQSREEEELRITAPDSLSRRKKRRSSTTSRPSSSLQTKTIPSRESNIWYLGVAMQGTHADHAPATKSGMPSSTCSSHRRRKCSGYRRQG